MKAIALVRPLTTVWRMPAMRSLLAFVGSGCDTSATSSFVFDSGGGDDCCARVVHPATSTAAIVVIRRCFICSVKYELKLT